MSELKVSIQGFKGSFHEQAALEYFYHSDLELIPAPSFDLLAKQLALHECDVAVMAIENSIAGSILQNYRLLRENRFVILGEKYLKIEHSLLGNQNSSLSSIQEVHSHPMAINQCLDFIHQNLPHAKLVETEDTALSAMQLSQNLNPTIACIAAKRNTDLYNLKLLAQNIESNKTNYTRFFIISREPVSLNDDVNKASVYLRIPDRKGQLLEVLRWINDFDLNLSKLQSYPVSESFREYYFYLDLEFSEISKYILLKEKLESITLDFNEMGVYKRADELVFNEIKSQKQIIA